MALAHETTVIYPGPKVGDVKIANYNISFTANQLVEPSNDPGWFLMNGAVISQTTYPVLFARFGTSFNTGGEGTGNFRLPDHTSRFPIGRGLTNFTTYATSGGEANHTLVHPGSGTSELPTHSHADTLAASAGVHGHSPGGTTDNGGAHTHTYSLVVITGDVGTPGGATQVSFSVANGAGSGSGGGSHTHTGSFSMSAATESFGASGSVSNNSPSGSGHNNMMPYSVIGGLLVKYG